MKSIEAKNLIIKAASEELGFKLADSTTIEQYLIIGVKLGNLTPEQAAEIINKKYAQACTETFNKAQA